MSDDYAPVKIGSPAPDFTLPDQYGNEQRLSAYRGKWVLIYFYPKDDTPGCTKEACAIRDSFPHFEEMNIAVLGVSTDPVESHERFAEKYRLPFPLLSDEDRKVVRQYGAWEEKQTFRRDCEGVCRMSFLIDPLGEVEKIYKEVKPETHAEEVLHDLAALMKNEE